MLSSLFKNLALPLIGRERAKRMGLKMIKLGTHMAFDHKRGDARKDPKFQSDINRLKNGINCETRVGAYSENGGHSLADCKPICEFSSISVLNVMRSPESYLADSVPEDKFKQTTTKSEHLETW